MEKLKRPQQESNMSVHYSSKTDDWATPQDFFDQLDKAEIRFVKGRLKFGGATTGAPFPSMVIVFR